MNKTALVLIDIQNIYFTKGHYLLSEPEKAATNAKMILEIFRMKGMPVIHVKHAFNTDRYVEDSKFLNDIYTIVTPIKGEKIVEKKHPNSFLGTELLEHLHKLGVQDLVVAGMMSHMCVDTTVRACQDYGFNVTVIDDACTTKALEWNGMKLSAEVVHDSYMAGLTGMFAKVIHTDDFIKELQGCSKSEHSKCR